MLAVFGAAMSAPVQNLNRAADGGRKDRKLMRDFIEITEGTLVRREAVVSIRPIGSNRVEVSLINGVAFSEDEGELENSA
jgi:hypothetical protein